MAMDKEKVVGWLIHQIGGRKSTMFVVATLALCFGPEAAHASIVTCFGILVGGNGWEHHTQTRGEPLPEPPPEPEPAPAPPENPEP